MCEKITALFKEANENYLDNKQSNGMRDKTKLLTEDWNEKHN